MISDTTTFEAARPRTRLGPRVILGVAVFLAVIALSIVGLRELQFEAPAAVRVSEAKTVDYALRHMPAPAIVDKTSDYALRHPEQASDVPRVNEVDYALRHMDE